MTSITASLTCKYKILFKFFSEKISLEDGDFNSIAFPNPQAEDIAKRMDEERGRGHVRSVLHGIPIVIKDNIDTADEMMTSAGNSMLSCQVFKYENPSVILALLPNDRNTHLE